MKKIIEIKNSNIRKLRINYDLGNLCNYKCWYCFPGSNEGDSPFPNVDIVKNNVVSLINYYLDSKIVDEVHLSLLGGEPTLWKDLGEFVKYISTNSKCKIYIITNGSRTIRWWNEYAEYFDSINISIHHEKVDLEHIQTLTDLLYKKNLCFYTDVLMDHTAWDKCFDIVGFLKNTKKKFMVLAKPINIGSQTFYNEEQRKYLQSHLKRKPALKTILKYWKTFNDIADIEILFDDDTKIKTKNEQYFVLNMMNQFNGWSCNLGVNYLFIDRKGSLTGACKQKLYGLDHYYNINDLNFSEIFSPTITSIVCEQQFCMCPGETALTKKRISP